MKKQNQDELVFLPLGGSDEVGMNLNAYGFGPEANREWLIVDVGVTVWRYCTCHLGIFRVLLLQPLL